jgi:arginase
MDMGQRRRGVDMGPSALRYAGLQEHLRRLGYAVHDCGNLDVPVVEEVTERESSARYVEAVAEVCNRVYQEILACVAEDDFAIVLGGDHSISIGSIAAMARRRPTGVIWVDAHGDFNTPETSPSGNVHGMPVAALIGQGAPSLVNVGYAGAKLQPSQIVMIGVRDLDPEERVRLAESHISVFTMAEIDEHGIAEGRARS